MDDTVETMILDRLKEIHQSLHDLREDFHSVVGKVAAFDEWRKAHDVAMEEWTARARDNKAVIDQHEKTLNQVEGAIRTAKWLGSAVAALIGIGEFMLHYGADRPRDHVQVESTTIAPSAPRHP